MLFKQYIKKYYNILQVILSNETSFIFEFYTKKKDFKIVE